MAIKMKSSLLLLALIFLVACAQQEVKEILIPRHNVIYTFSYDIRESLGVPAENAAEIIETTSRNNRVIFVFNGSSEKDNALFAVTSFNIVSKLDQYFYNEGASVYFDVYYLVNDTWYNKTKEVQQNLDLSGTVVWLKGPDTGAQRTVVYMKDGYIFVEGADEKGVVLAGDRLVLLVMGVNRFEDIEGMR